MSKSSNYKTVSDYFDAQLENTKHSLLVLKECVLKVVPNAKELFNYNIQSYALIDGGKRETQIMNAANKTSVGFYPHPTTIEKFEGDLEEFKYGKGSVQFPLEKPIPQKLVVKMVEYRLDLLTNK